MERKGNGQGRRGIKISIRIGPLRGRPPGLGTRTRTVAETGVGTGTGRAGHHPTPLGDQKVHPGKTNLCDQH